MNPINAIKSAFGGLEFDISERVKIVISSFSIFLVNSPKYADIVEAISSIPRRDVLQLTFIADDEHSLVVNSDKVLSEQDYLVFFDTISDYETIDVKIHIRKSVVSNVFSIYSFIEFAKNLLTEGTLSAMKTFSLILGTSEFICFETYDSVSVFSTETMIFTPDINTKRPTTDIVRSKRIMNCSETSFFQDINEYRILPDDFRFLLNYDNNPLSELFNKIATILSLIYISSSASINEDHLKLHISGQRNVDFCYNIDTVKYNLEIIKICSWIYSENSYVDKALLARNILSLHCRYSDLKEIDGKTFATIKSNYSLYLKDNVSHYIEIKNKLAAYIAEVVTKTGEYATSMLSGLKTNLLAIFVFLFTVVLTNIVTESSVNNIFTKDITLILDIVILGSFAYMGICIIETRSKLKEALKAFDALKNNYKDDLSVDECNDVFKGDQIKFDVKKTVNFGIWLYSLLWSAALITMFILFENASDYPFVWNFFMSIL